MLRFTIHIVLAAGFLGLTGCASGVRKQPVFVAGSQSLAPAETRDNVRLVSQRSQPVQTPGDVNRLEEVPSKSRRDELIVGEGASKDSFAGQPKPSKSGGESTRPGESTSDSAKAAAVVNLPYSVPSLWARRMTFAAASAAVAAPAVEERGGREFAEGAVMLGASVGGRAGLASPEAVVGAAVLSRRGLQENNVGGLGFANPTNNIFRPAFNPLSGPGGRCAELGSAGFFGANAGACEQHFRR